MQPKEILPSQLVLLRQIGISLRHSLDFPQICKTVVDILRSESGAENCSIYLATEHQPPKLVLVAAMGCDDEMPAFYFDQNESVNNGKYFELGVGVLGRAAIEQRSILVKDVRRNHDFLTIPSSPVSIGSLLSVPLIVEDRLLGGLNLSHPETNKFDLLLLALMESVADLVAKALQNAKPELVTRQCGNGQRQVFAEIYDEIIEQEKKYRFLVEKAPDGIVIVRDGKLIFANPSFQQMVDKENVLGSSIFDFLLCPEMCNQNGRYLISQSGSSAETNNFCFETSLQRENRKPLAVEVTGCQMNNYGEDVFYLFFRDVSCRAQLDKIKDTFFASLVHELKNPITVIHSYLQLLTTYKSGFSEQQHKLLRDMQAATKRLMKLLNDIMSYSRLNCLEQPLQLKKWQINEEIENTVKFFHPLLSDKNISVQLELQPNLEPFPFDREKINQVLVNLLDNAVKFTPPGGTITLRSRSVLSQLPDDQSFLGCDATLGIETKCAKRFVEISVADTGVGLPADEEMVFNEFYTTANSTGTGLGLPICRKIVHCHNGEIKAASTKHGSIFTFLLPMDSCSLSSVNN